MPASTKVADLDGAIIVDLQALQSPATRGRGIGRYAAELCIALENFAPRMVGRYLLNPDLPPPEPIETLIATGKMAYADDPGAIDDRARIVHLLSPLDLTVPATSLYRPEILTRPLLLSATVYDLIPAISPERELGDIATRRRYRTHLEIVRAAHGIHVLSDSVAHDVGRILHISAAKIFNVGAAPAERFVAPASREDARRAARERFFAAGLRRPYVLAPSGSHPRKNNERLIEAWSRLSAETRENSQLVIVGDLPSSMANHLRHLAQRNAPNDELVLPGYVEDDALVALYQGASLVCFISLEEGFGLPIVEALSCGAPTIGSDRPPFDELLAKEAHVDPENVEELRAAIESALDQNTDLTALIQPAKKLLTGTEVASNASEGFVATLQSSRIEPGSFRARKARRPRLAIVSPLPPAPSGVAAYSNRLIEALVATDFVDIELFGDGPTPHQHGPDGLRALRPESLIDCERLQGPYDEILYTIGNSHHHIGALRLVQRRHGVVLAHDVRLSNCYGYLHGDPGFLPGGFAREISEMYRGGFPAGLGASGELSTVDMERFGVFMGRQTILRAKKFLVSSNAAAALAHIDAGGWSGEKVAVLPFAIGLEAGPTSAMEFSSDDQSLSGASGIDLDPRTKGPVVAHFGIVDPVKEPEIFLAAVAQARRTIPQISAAFVGPCSTSMAQQITEWARGLNLEDAVVLTGSIDNERYRAWLSHAAVAVQLRSSFNGEASAAIGDCLSVGLPTIVREVGWCRELPDHAVTKVTATASAKEIGSQIERLIEDTPRREALREGALETARERTFEKTATALLSVLFPSEGFATVLSEPSEPVVGGAS